MKHLIVLLSLQFVYLIAYTQVSISEDASNPHASSMLDIKSSDKGVLIPRMSTTERDAIPNPANGLMVYDATTASFWYFESGIWNEIASQSRIVSPTEEYETISTTPAGPFPRHIVVDGRYAYIVDQDDNDLKIIDISNPNALRIISSLPIGSFPYRLDVQDDYAYVVDQETDSLYVVNVADPNAPLIEGSVQIGTASSGIVVDGNYAYIINFGDDELLIVDITDKSNPVPTGGTLSLGNWPRNIKKSGDYVYITDNGSNDIKAINVSDVNNPTLSDSHSAGSAIGLDIKGNHAFVTDISTHNLRIYDISDPTNLSIVTSVSSTTSMPIQVAVQDDFAYLLSSQNEEITIFDISDVSNPQSIAEKSTGDSPIWLAVNGNYAYVIDYIEDHIMVIWIGDLSTQLQVGFDESGNLVTSTDLDHQTLDLTGTNLSISNGNSVDLDNLSDNLGNHIATSNIKLDGNWVSGDGDSEGLFVASNGRIGINNSNPTADLHVDSLALIGNLGVGNQSVSQDSSSHEGRGYMTTPWIYTNAIEAQNERGGESTLITLGNEGYYGVNDEIHLITKGQRRLTATSTGNIGIATVTPQEKLDVAGNIQLSDADPDLVFFDDTGSNGARRSAIQTNMYSNLSGFDSPEDQEMSFHVSDNSDSGMTRVMTLRGDGNVGVGAANPTAKLDVNGSIRIRGGAPQAGTILTSTDGNGNAVWQDPVDRIAGTIDLSTQSFDDSDSWRDVSATISLSNVLSDDMLFIRAQATPRLTEGTNSDPFNIRVSVSGCMVGITNSYELSSPEGSADHNNWLAFPYQNFFTATGCNNETLEFKLQIRNTGDDAWEVKDTVLIVQKY